MKKGRQAHVPTPEQNSKFYSYGALDFESGDWVDRISDRANSNATISHLEDILAAYPEGNSQRNPFQAVPPAPTGLADFESPATGPRAGTRILGCGRAIIAYRAALASRRHGDAGDDQWPRDCVRVCVGLRSEPVSGTPVQEIRLRRFLVDALDVVLATAYHRLVAAGRGVP